MADDSGTSARQDVESRVMGRALTDADFRQLLLSDPRAAVQDELGVDLPADVTINVVEEKADTIYLVLPPTEESSETGELSDAELGAVAGGGDWMSGTTCPMTCFRSCFPATCR